MKLKYYLLLGVVLTILPLAIAQIPPMNVNGNVKIGDAGAADGLNLMIKINGVDARTISLSEAHYSADLESGVNGQTVTFFITDHQANEQTTYKSGKIETIDLSFDSFCGDTVCNNGETTATCASDCSAACGNNLKEGTEVCDGTALDSKTCATQGFTGGTLACKADCSAFDTSSCTTDSNGGGGGGGSREPSGGQVQPSESKVSVTDNSKTASGDESAAPPGTSEPNSEASPITGGGTTTNPKNILNFKVATAITVGVLIAGAAVYFVRKKKLTGKF